ncbi:hypothetical protein OPV22_012967 [Ensete ventricosum]|uniref:C2H2-type domain-containing protein n=1 Tax=Ensete ventricosum TaxID=4639 RepID=A0AAV8R3U7_ENSVE|nr:hypothetical protein OPV22_012967 [Ensete ventricosum]
MGARLTEGGSYCDSEDAALGAENSLGIRVKYAEEPGKDVAQEVTSSRCGDDEESVSEAGGAAAKDDGSSRRRHATCPECGKSFPSDKSLFGHLRRHPERDYRGVNPPPEARRKSGASPSSKRPSARRSRQRKVVTVDPEAIAAARILMHLADAKHRDARSDDTEEDELLSSYKRTIKRRKTEQVELANEPGTSDRGRRYRCSVCSKTFSSHQALGGHRASHNKNRSHHHPEEEEEDEAAAATTTSNHKREQQEDEADKGGSRGLLDFDLNEAPRLGGEES